MKIIHTADWHIGQTFYRYDRDDEHRHFMRRLAEIVADERPDALLVSGDVFHNPAPSNQAQRLLVDGLLAIRDVAPDTIIIVSAGNHDSGSRLDAESELWRRSGVHLIGTCRRQPGPDALVDPSQLIVRVGDKGYVIAIPWFHTSAYPAVRPGLQRHDRQPELFEAAQVAVPSDSLPVVLMAHLAVSGCDMSGHDQQLIGGLVKDDVATLGSGYDYLALGHIHKPQTIGPRVAYSGSALPISFDETYPHSVAIVEIAHRGSLPSVRRRVIEPLRSVVTLPSADGAPLQQALESLATFPDDDNSYVRILVDQDDPISPDADDRARRLLSGKQCRFCEIRRKPRATRVTESDGIDVLDIDDFTAIEPFEIALRSFEHIHHTPINDRLSAMMRQAINSTISPES